MLRTRRLSELCRSRSPERDTPGRRWPSHRAQAACRACGRPRDSFIGPAKPGRKVWRVEVEEASDAEATSSVLGPPCADSPPDPEHADGIGQGPATGGSNAG